MTKRSWGIPSHKRRPTSKEVENLTKLCASTFIWQPSNIKSHLVNSRARAAISLMIVLYLPSVPDLISSTTVLQSHAITTWSKDRSSARASASRHASADNIGGSIMSLKNMAEEPKNCPVWSLQIVAAAPLLLFFGYLKFCLILVYSFLWPEAAHRPCTSFF